MAKPTHGEIVAELQDLRHRIEEAHTRLEAYLGEPSLPLTHYEAEALLSLTIIGQMSLDDPEPWDRGEKAAARRALAKLRALVWPEVER